MLLIDWQPPSSLSTGSVKITSDRSSALRRPEAHSSHHVYSDPGPSLHSIGVQDVAELASDPPGFITLNLQTGHRPSLTTDVVLWRWREPPLEIATLKWSTATTSSGTPVTLQLDSTMILVVAEGLCQAWRLRMTEPGGSEARCVTSSTPMECWGSPGSPSTR